MKISMGRAVLLTALLFGPSAFVLAEDGSKDTEGHQTWSGMAEGGKGRLEKLKEKLGLNDGQVASLKDLLKKQAEETKPLREKMKVDMDTLRLKVDSGDPDSEIGKVLDKLDADKKKLENVRQGFMDRLRTILTPTQQAKFLLGMGARGKSLMRKRSGNRKGKIGL